MDIKKEVNESLLLMNNINYGQVHDTYHNYDKMMALGGDNFKGVCDKLDITGNSALIVNGSGDQPLELVFRNFTSIDSFDINKLSRHMLHLKIAAILALDYQEFVLFSKMLFKDEKLYQKIIPFLSEDTAKYFELLFYLKSKEEVYNMLLTHKFSQVMSSIWDFTKQNFSVYNEQEFYEIKRKLLQNNSSISFYNMDLLAPNNFSKKYDFIYFSNILFFLDNNTQFFIDEIFPIYINALNKDGLLVFFYMHFFSENCNYLNKKILCYFDDYFKIQCQKRNQKIYNKLKDSAEIVEQIPASGFGRGLGRNDMFLALKRK